MTVDLVELVLPFFNFPILFFSFYVPLSIPVRIVAYWQGFVQIGLVVDSALSSFEYFATVIARFVFRFFVFFPVSQPL